MSDTPWRGAEALRPLLVPLRSLTMDPANARRHPKRNIEAIRASLRAFGQRKPLVVAQGFVFAGCGTLQAADLEGWQEIAVVEASDLSSEQLRAYAVADNQTGDLAEWDPEALAKSLGPLPEGLKLATGFNPEETKAIVDLAFSKSKDEGEAKPEFATIKLTRDQYVIVQGACAKLREQEGQPDMTEARAVELLAAEFLS